VAEPKTWSWEAFGALPSEEVRTDIHCVTKWSKLDTRWEGVSIDALLEGIEHHATHVLAFSDGDYTTNLPLEDLVDGKAWVATVYDGGPLEPGTPTFFINGSRHDDSYEFETLLGALQRAAHIGGGA